MVGQFNQFATAKEEVGKFLDQVSEYRVPWDFTKPADVATEIDQLIEEEERLAQMRLAQQQEEQSRALQQQYLEGASAPIQPDIGGAPTDGGTLVGQEGGRPAHTCLAGDKPSKTPSKRSSKQRKG